MPTASAAKLAALAWLAAGCGSGDPGASSTHAQPIVGGAPSAEGAWPSVVWLDVGCSGTLLHERLVLYAAHCGTHAERVYAGGQLDGALERSVEFCAAHPDFRELGDGNDLAFCVLREPLQEVPIVPLALGCEREQLQAGDQSVLVGFGESEDSTAAAGTKREVQAPLVVVDAELEIGELDKGTCGGDSGGPAFTPVGADDEWRQVGVLSSGTTEGCGRGYYTDVARFVDWLESASQLDLSPCGDSFGSWQPSPLCRVPALDERGLPLADRTEIASSSCGPALELSAETDSPRVTVRSVSVEETGDVKRVIIDVDASDEVAGVRSVMLEVLDVEDALMTMRLDEIPPYSFELLVPTQARLARVTALDFFGNRTATQADLITWSDVQPFGGCQVQRANARSLEVSCWILGALIVLRLRGTRRRRASSA